MATKREGRAEAPWRVQVRASCCRRRCGLVSAVWGLNDRALHAGRAGTCAFSPRRRPERVPLSAPGHEPRLVKTGGLNPAEEAPSRSYTLLEGRVSWIARVLHVRRGLNAPGPGGQERSRVGP